MLKYSNILIVDYFRNLYIKYKYLAKILNFLINNKIVYTFQTDYIKPQLKEQISQHFNLLLLGQILFY